MQKIEQIFGGRGVQRCLTSCKRLLCLLLTAAVAASLAGCGASKQDKQEAASQQADYEAQTAIKKQIEDTPIPAGYFTLIDDEAESWITVTCKDGEATVSIRAFMNYTIPYAAELFLPIAQEAAEAAGVKLARFDVNSYNTNKDGVVDGTWASWQTNDGSKGTLTDSTGGENTVKPGLTLEEVFDYYADYDGIVKDMISEAGGSYE